jgi:hypothetical protein
MISKEERATITWDIWYKLTATGFHRDKEPQCKFYRGLDEGGRGLCDNHQNRGTVPQEKGCKRCNILCCPGQEKIQNAVNAFIAKKELQQEQERQRIKTEEDLAAELCRYKDAPKPIDLTDYVSEDSLAYA